MIKDNLENKSEDVGMSLTRMFIEKFKELPSFGSYWNLNSPGLQQGYPVKIVINYSDNKK